MELFDVLVGGPIASLLNCHAPPVKHFLLFIIPEFIGFTYAGIWYIMEGQGKSNYDRNLIDVLGFFRSNWLFSVGNSLSVSKGSNQ